MHRMRGFIHVSTAYVNSNLPRGSHIEERIYPLHDAQGARIQHAALAARLAALPHAKAEHVVSHCHLAYPKTYNSPVAVRHHARS